MQKLLFLGALLCGILVTQYGFSADVNYRNADVNYSNSNVVSSEYAAGGDCACDTPCGDCYCLMCHQEPCYYNEWRCVDCPVTYKRQCCRWVPREYQVQRCRYVPQYYCETCCRYERENYCVDECCNVKKWVCDRKCRYVPRYYYKHVCQNTGCCAPSCQ